MSEKAPPVHKRGRQVYIQHHIVQLVEDYAKDNHITFPRAINEILGRQFRNSSHQDHDPATKQDIKKLLKRIELINLMIEPPLLELLEASSTWRQSATRDPEVARLGKEVKQKYKHMFEDLRDIL